MDLEILKKIAQVVVGTRQEMNLNSESLQQKINSTAKTTQDEIKKLSGILAEGFSKIIGTANEMEEIKKQVAQLKGQLQEKDDLLQEKEAKILSLEEELLIKKQEEENVEQESKDILDLLNSSIPNPAHMPAKPE
ncbi:MAG TPA: hypothetical protein PLZ62_00065 [bacterium]|nr:hypothetical protein [bacterium]